MRNFRVLTLLAFAAIMVIIACSKEQRTKSASEQQAASSRACEVTVAFFNDGPGGNYNCPVEFDFSSGRINIDQNYNPQTGNAGPIIWEISADGKYLSWSGDVCGMAVVVKGANGSNVYTYNQECKSGVALTSPPKNGKIPQISNITFCWDECDECESETAFGGNTAGAGPAWWFAFDVAGAPCQDIYAGQQLMPGASVCYANGELIITLGSGWELDPSTSESVKIQGYTTLPTKRPSAGHFQYKGTSLVVAVDPSPYYVIHLDVVQCQ